MKHERTLTNLEVWLKNEEREIGFLRKEQSRLEDRLTTTAREIAERERTISDLRGAIAALRGEEEA